jgi:amidase
MLSTLIADNACNLVHRLKCAEISPHDLLDALEQRIGKVNPAVNALPTLCFDRARAHADELMRRPIAARGLLAGMPVPIKDLTDVAGVRTTYGSPIYADHIAEESDLLVQNLERQGGIIYAKSNTPEFGAGANTFNEVFGATRNPWNLGRSAAGSSGGAAVALATGMAWLAHGSDMGGSLRNPASFCGVVGLRPSSGRVGRSVAGRLDQTLGVQGPMARNVEDLALLLDAMSGFVAQDPLSMPAPEEAFLRAARSGWLPKRVAYTPDLGITPVATEVKELTRKAALRVADAGTIVEEAHPDFTEAHQCFQVLRALQFALSWSKLLSGHRHQIKPELVENIEQGLRLSIEQIQAAETARVVMFRRTLAFFEKYELLICPATIVPPFPVTQRYVTECAGHHFGNYVEWLAIAYAITLVCCPALSLPCGFTKEGLPVGLQIVAPPKAEGRLLAGAKCFEDLLGLAKRVPINPRSPNPPSPR